MPVPLPAVICVSGGMDSTSLLLKLLAEGRDVFALSFDYGQKHRIELDRIDANFRYLISAGFAFQWKLIDLSDIAELLHSALTVDDWQVPAGHYKSQTMKQTVVPNRNAIFASISYAWALSLSQQRNSRIEICLGVHSGDHAIYPDCKPDFYQAIFHAFKIGNWDSDNISFHLPFLKWDKVRILQDAQRSIELLGLDFETVFRNTITSYQPDESGRSDGLTGADVERILAFEKLGVIDPIDYCEPWPVIVARAKAVEQEFQLQESIDGIPTK